MERASDIDLHVTRVGVIGDVHTESDVLRLALEFFSGSSVDRVLCTGDLPDGPLDAAHVARCCELLERHQVVTISGNHDRWLQDGEMRDIRDATDPAELPETALRFLAALPATVELESPLGRILLCHGIGTDDMCGVQPFDHGMALERNPALAAVVREDRYRFLISGHTHRPMVRSVGSLTLINAGTLLRDHGPCCAVVDFGRRTVRFHAIVGGKVTDAGTPLPF